MKASLMISTPQRLFISVLVNRDCPTAFMIKIRKSVQNIIRHLIVPDVCRTMDGSGKAGRKPEPSERTGGHLQTDVPEAVL